MDDYERFALNNRPRGPSIAHGRGARIWDVQGNEYLDCCSQTLNLNLGQCHPEIEEAVIEQVRSLTFLSSRFATDAVTRLVASLISATPHPLSRVNLRSTSGSSANEAALKAARKRSGKRLILSFMHSHHGQTVEAMRISGKHFSNGYLGDRGAVFLPQPHSTSGELSQEQLQELYDLQDGDVAALIVEPVQVNAGVIPFSKAYLQTLRAFCSENGVALIFDEVQTGFGWLGAMHAMAHFGVTPDIVTFGKGLGAGYPLAATLFTDDYDVLEYGEHELTYGAHPTSCAAACKMIEILGRPGFLEDVREKALLVEGELAQLARQCSRVRAVRGVGLIWGVEIDIGEREKTTFSDDIVRHLLNQGLIMRTSNRDAHSNVLVFKPPLIMSSVDISAAIDRLGSAIESL